MSSEARTTQSGGARSLSSDKWAHPALIGPSRLFQQVIAVCDAVAENDCLVLIEGESGTGKELLARRIHGGSPRSEGPFIPINCAGVSEGLFESQFFGHVKGAFTGAASETLGVVRAAETGTLLLDEIGEVPQHLQPKLLRLLQEREVTPVGSSRPIRVDTRFVASTNRSLQRMVHDRKFRADLYHRLNIVRIFVPPLRSRPEDIDPLVDYYLDSFSREYNRPSFQLAKATRQQLRQYTWPGNVRELRAYIERLYATETVPLPPGCFSWEDGYGYDWLGEQSEPPLEAAPGRITRIDSTPVILPLAEMERQAIRRALAYSRWNRTEAARLLAIHRSTLIRKIRNHNIRPEQ